MNNSKTLKYIIMAMAIIMISGCGGGGGEGTGGTNIAELQNNTDAATWIKDVMFISRGFPTSSGFTTAGLPESTNTNYTITRKSKTTAAKKGQSEVETITTPCDKSGSISEKSQVNTQALELTTTYEYTNCETSGGIIYSGQQTLVYGNPVLTGNEITSWNKAKETSNNLSIKSNDYDIVINGKSEYIKTYIYDYTLSSTKESTTINYKVIDNLKNRTINFTDFKIDDIHDYNSSPQRLEILVYGNITDSRFGKIGITSTGLQFTPGKYFPTKGNFTLNFSNGKALVSSIENSIEDTISVAITRHNNDTGLQEQAAITTLDLSLKMQASDQIPKAIISTGVEGLLIRGASVELNANAYKSEDSKGDLISLNWKVFTTENPSNPIFVTTEAILSLPIKNLGGYEVELTATDLNGQTHKTSKHIHIYKEIGYIDSTEDKPSFDIDNTGTSVAYLKTAPNRLIFTNSSSNQTKTISLPDFPWGNMLANLKLSTDNQLAILYQAPISYYNSPNKIYIANTADGSILKSITIPTPNIPYPESFVLHFNFVDVIDSEHILIETYYENNLSNTHYINILTANIITGEVYQSNGMPIKAIPNPATPREISLNEYIFQYGIPGQTIEYVKVNTTNPQNLSIQPRKTIGNWITSNKYSPILPIYGGKSLIQNNAIYFYNSTSPEYNIPLSGPNLMAADIFFSHLTNHHFIINGDGYCRIIKKEDLPTATFNKIDVANAENFLSDANLILPTFEYGDAYSNPAAIRFTPSKQKNKIYYLTNGGCSDYSRYTGYRIIQMQ